MKDNYLLKKISHLQVLNKRRETENKLGTKDFESAHHDLF